MSIKIAIAIVIWIVLTVVVFIFNYGAHMYDDDLDEYIDYKQNKEEKK